MSSPIGITLNWFHQIANTNQPEDPESRPVPDAGVEVPDEEEPGDVAADDARRRELHRVREAVVPRQRVQQQTGVAIRHFTKRRCI